jgi:transposase-like protein
MTSTKNNPSPDKTNKPTRTKTQPSQNYTATEKAQAVLAVWTERCKAAEVCRQMKITGMTFHQWQQRAMEGMLQALESRVNLSKGEVLSQKRATQPRQLSRRLQQIQLASAAEPTAQNP